MGRWYHWGMVAVLAVVLGMGKFLGVEATNSFSQTNWADNSFSSSSGVTTTTANQITLSNPSGWLNNAWKYRQSVGVTNATGLGLTDYQVPIFLDTAALISAAKMKNDCSDLRVADASGNSLSFWISTSPAADTCGQTKTKIWVKAASLPTTGTNLYVYYGNSSANSQSNGSDVFPVFADFTVGTSLPSNWFQANIGTSGTYSVGGSLAISNTNGEDVWNSVYGATHVYYGTKINGSFTAETLITSQANSNEWSKSGISIQNEMASGGGNGQAFIITTPSNGVPFQYQSLSGEQCNGGVCSNVIAPNVNLGSAAGGTNLPLFLKMKKSSDNRISGYRSADGSSWTQRGTSEIPWGAETNQYVSLFITPHNTSATGKATYTFFIPGNILEPSRKLVDQMVNKKLIHQRGLWFRQFLMLVLRQILGLLTWE